MQTGCRPGAARSAVEATTELQAEDDGGSALGSQWMREKQ